LISIPTITEPRVSALAWLAFCVSALLALRVPFTGDQYFFALGAEAIARGDTLYVDFWDIKQPGIFYLYRIASLVHEDVTLTIRILEILTWAVTCVLARQLLLSADVDRPIAALTPAALGAAYFLAAPAWHLSQVESFAVLPLTYCLRIAVRAESRRRDWVLLGAATAVVGWLKLVLVLIPAVFAVLLLWRTWRHRTAAAGGWTIATDIGVAACAFIATLAVLLVPFWSRDGLMVLLDVTWVYPSEAMYEVPGAPLTRLGASLLWFGVTTAPMGLLACSVVRLRPVPFVVWLLLTGFVATLVCISLQRFSWWAYHTTLLRVPVTLLALLACGVRVTQASPARARWIAGLTTLFAIAMTLPGAAKKLTVLPDSLFAATPSPRFEARTAPGYEQLREQADGFVAEFGSHASLCVLGDTALSYHTRAKCDVTLATWSAPAMNAAKWRQLATELHRARPDILYVSGSDLDVLRVNQPEVLEWIEREYVLLRPGMPRDAWHMRQDFPSRR
jgi:hypothetical protein